MLVKPPQATENRDISNAKFGGLIASRWVGLPLVVARPFDESSLPRPLTNRCSLLSQEAKMTVFDERQLNTYNPDKRALLYVSDYVSDSPEFVAFAIKLAEKHGASLELLQVIDPS